jgi:hypothetical protein
MKPCFTATMFMLALIAGCSAVGVVEVSDPAAKLAQAGALYDRQDRPLPAERLIREAIATYDKTGDDVGLAEGYREYGFLLRSRAVEHWEKAYRANGFLDTAVTFDTRLQASAAYFEKAKVLLVRSGKFDKVSNVEFNEGISLAMLHRTVEACAALDSSMSAQRRAVAIDPSLKPQLPKEFTTYEELVLDAKRRVGCES